MKSRLRILALLSFAATVSVAKALNLDTSGSVGNLNYDDGMGNTATASLDIVSSNAPELGFIESSLASDGLTVQWGGDLDGDVAFHGFGIIDFGGTVHTANGYKVIGLSWNFDFIGNGNDFDDLGHTFFNYVSKPGGDFWSSENGDPNDPAYSIEPSLSVGGNYGWHIDDTSYTDSRYVLLGKREGDVVTLYNGVKMTMDARLAKPVPEPASLACLGLAAAALLRRRK